ncbi:MAG: type II toxin-antitoxin system Phd/YefM family antitoxin [bacterium]
MIKVSATKLRKHLFDYLDRAAAGETIVIQRNNEEVARLPIRWSLMRPSALSLWF